MIIQLFLGLIIIGLICCFSIWGIFRVQHKFWSSVPGPHFYHEICSELGYCKKGIIRKTAAIRPQYHSYWNDPQLLELSKISEYVNFFNKNYHISNDYKHVFTNNVLTERLFASGVIGLHLIDNNHIIAIITSCPLKTDIGDVGMIDYLCVDNSVRGNRLANYMIGWMDRYTSMIGRRVHFFEREMKPAPIPSLYQTIYMYCECSGNGIAITNKIAIDEVVSKYNVIDSNLYNRSDIWADKSENGSWIVQNAFMCSIGENESEFGIVLGINGNPMKDMCELSPWKYLIMPSEFSSLEEKSIEWKYSSTSWTHIYNYVIEKNQIFKILY